MNYSFEQENATPQELDDALYKEDIISKWPISIFDLNGETNFIFISFTWFSNNNKQIQKNPREVYPHTIIVFCLIHIRKKLLTHFHNDNEIIRLFDNIQNNIMS